MGAGHIPIIFTEWGRSTWDTCKLKVFILNSHRHSWDTNLTQENKEDWKTQKDGRRSLILGMLINI